MNILTFNHVEFSTDFPTFYIDTLISIWLTVSLILTTMCDVINFLPLSRQVLFGYTVVFLGIPSAVYETALEMKRRRI